MTKLDERNVQHICVCQIALAGDPQQVVVRDESRPITWGEVAVLQALHGDEALMDIRPIGLIGYRGAFNEKQRLASIYGFEAVDKVYPGRTPRIEQFVPGWPTEVERAKAPKPRPPRATVLAPAEVV